ncbi:MAG: hypothetical protein IEMM0008_0040 [bacterium]|nr:MAG: hypothetical protein IEMM0008_0040 [bacterium]
MKKYFKPLGIGLLLIRWQKTIYIWALLNLISKDVKYKIYK